MSAPRAVPRRQALVQVLRGGAIIVLASVTLAACWSRTAPFDLGDRTVVSVAVFSGRPDPEWELTDAEAKELGIRLGLLSASASVPPEGGLGYRGFWVFADDPKRRVAAFVAYGGVVAPPGSGARSLLLDPTRSVERFLLDTGRPYLGADVIRAIQDSLASP